MRRLERGRVVAPVSRHRDNFAVGFERLDYAQLLFRYRACEHRRTAGSYSQFGVVHAVKIGAGHDVARVQSSLFRDRPRRVSM